MDTRIAWESEPKDGWTYHVARVGDRHTATIFEYGPKNCSILMSNGPAIVKRRSTNRGVAGAKRIARTMLANAGAFGGRS